MAWLRSKAQSIPAFDGTRLVGETPVRADAFLEFIGSGTEPLYPEPDFMTASDVGFDKNELVYACIMEKATSLPDAPFRVFGPDGRGEPRENHPLRQLLANPNPAMTEFEMVELTSIYLDLAGIAFWEIVLDRVERPVELWPLRPDRVRIYPQNNGKHEYGYTIGGGRVAPLGTDVLTFRLPNPEVPWLGKAPMRPANRAVALDNEATDFVKALLQNHAVPGAVVETENAIDKDVTDRLTERWIERFGRGNRGRPAFLQKGMKVHSLGLDLGQLEFPDLRTISESRICMSFGVPPILVGAKVGLDRCLPAQSRVWTTSGAVPIVDVKPGMIVWSVIDGRMKPRPVTNWAQTDVRPVYAVRTKNRVIRASGNHPILVRVPGSSTGGNATRSASYTYRHADQIQPGDWVVQAKSVPDQGWETGPDGHRLTPAMAKWLGAMLGDGSVTDSVIRMAMPPADRCHDEYVALARSLFTRQAHQSGGGVAVQDLIARAPITVGIRDRDFGFRSAQGARLLTALGVAGTARTKRVPPWVHTLSRPLRLEFLAGLVDTDGSIDRRGALTFAFANQALTHDVRDLLVGCGIQASNVAEFDVPADALPQPGIHESYRAWRFTASSAVAVAAIPFVDPLYRERVEANTGRDRPGGFDAAKAGLDPEQLGFYRVRSVTLEPAEPLYDIEVAGGGHNFLADGVVVSNSTFANYGEARRSFWEETLMPLQRRMQQVIVKRLMPMLEGPRPRRSVARFDNSEVLALRESEGRRWELATNALRAGAITVNQFARQVGIPQAAGADVYLRPAGVIPTDATGKPLHNAPATATPPPAPDSDGAAQQSSVVPYVERAACAKAIAAVVDQQRADVLAGVDEFAALLSLAPERFRGDLWDRSKWNRQLARAIAPHLRAAAVAAAAEVAADQPTYPMDGYILAASDAVARRFNAETESAVAAAVAVGGPDVGEAVEHVFALAAGYLADRTAAELDEEIGRFARADTAKRAGYVTEGT